MKVQKIKSQLEEIYSLCTSDQSLTELRSVYNQYILRYLRDQNYLISVRQIAGNGKPEQIVNNNPEKKHIKLDDLAIAIHDFKKAYSRHINFPEKFTMPSTNDFIVRPSFPTPAPVLVPASQSTPEKKPRWTAKDVRTALDNIKTAKIQYQKASEEAEIARNHAEKLKEKEDQYAEQYENICKVGRRVMPRTDGEGFLEAEGELLHVNFETLDYTTPKIYKLND